MYHIWGLRTFDEGSDKLGPATIASEESTDLIYLDWAERKINVAKKLTFVAFGSRNIDKKIIMIILIITILAKIWPISKNWPLGRMNYN